MTWRVLITCPPMLATIEHCHQRLKEEGIEAILPEVIQQLSEQQLCDLIVDVDGVIAGDDPFTRKVLETGRASKLTALAKWGIGVDAIDLDAAKELGIATSNTPDVFGDEVADVAIGYLVMLARQLHRIDEAVRSGEWLKIRGISLHGKTAGIIGIGSIGRAIAHRCKAIGMDILGYDIRQLSDDDQHALDLKQVELSVLMGSSDFVFVASVLTKENRHMLGGDQFSAMKPGGYVINVARGQLIDEKSLIAALDSGILAGAALDVFENEPLTQDNPLSRYENVILGSHNGSNTLEAVLKVNQKTIDNLVSDLKKASR